MKIEDLFEKRSVDPIAIAKPTEKRSKTVPVPDSAVPRYTAMEWAIIEGGHTLEETTPVPKLFDFGKY